MPPWMEMKSRMRISACAPGCCAHAGFCFGQLQRMKRQMAVLGMKPLPLGFVAGQVQARQWLMSETALWVSSGDTL